MDVTRGGHTALVAGVNNRILWTAGEVAAATAGRIQGDADTVITSLAIDSRALEAGALFVALPGDLSHRFHVSSTSSRDGHEFLAAAQAAGAAAALVSTPQADLVMPQIVVADTVDALWDLGRAGRARLNGDVVAVTGSSGKTTFKSMLSQALGAHATAGSLNNHLGVPISLAAVPPAAGAAVIEIGTSSAGEIAPLSSLTAPHVAVLLNVQSAHIGNFANFEALRREKCAISTGLLPGGTLVVHEDVACNVDVACLTFGTSEAADLRLVGMDGAIAHYRFQGSDLRACVPGGGQHRALTLAAVLGALHALGRDLEPALAMDDAVVPGGRGTVLSIGGIEVIDDSYNANPASMTGALRAFQARPAGRRLAVLGEMLELGGQSEALHQSLQPELEGLDGVWLVGEGMRVLEAPASMRGWCQRADDALIDALVTELRPGDVLLVKGSNRVFWATGFVSKLVEQAKKSPALGETPGNYH